MGAGLRQVLHPPWQFLSLLRTLRALQLWKVGPLNVCHDSTESKGAYSVVEPAGLGVRVTVSPVLGHHHRTDHRTLRCFSGVNTDTAALAFTRNSSCKRDFVSAVPPPELGSWLMGFNMCGHGINVYSAAWPGVMLLIRVAWGRD